MNSPLVYIIVLNWNGWRDTIECLESLQRLTYPNYQVVVVDNGSTDDSVQQIKAWADGKLQVESKFFSYDPTQKPVYYIEYDRGIAEAGGVPEREMVFEGVNPKQRLVIVRAGENLGFAGGNNVGIRYALACGAEYVLLLNNDVVVEPMALTYMVEMGENDKEVGVVGPKVYFYSNPKRIWSAGIVVEWGKGVYTIGYGEEDSPSYGASGERDALSGCCLLVRKKVLEIIGLFDPDLFLFHEETDFCLRARAGGFKSIIVPKSVVYHKGGASISKTSSLLTYYLTRNLLYLAERHLPSPNKEVIIGQLTLRLIIRNLIGIGKNAIKSISFPEKRIDETPLPSMKGLIDFYMRRRGKKA